MKAFTEAEEEEAREKNGIFKEYAKTALSLNKGRGEFLKGFNDIMDRIHRESLRVQDTCVAALLKLGNPWDTISRECWPSGEIRIVSSRGDGFRIFLDFQEIVRGPGWIDYSVAVVADWCGGDNQAEQESVGSGGVHGEC